jgi:hypothetical protein
VGHHGEICRVVEDRRVGGWRKKILARHVQNEDVNLAIRLEGGSEQIAMEISFMLSPKMIAGANCHHATRRARDLPLPGARTVRW